MSAPAGLCKDRAASLELPACSQQRFHGCRIGTTSTKLRMLSRTWWAQSSHGPLGTSAQEPAPGALLVQNQLELAASQGRVAKGDVLYLCLVLLRYQYQNVP